MSRFAILLVLIAASASGCVLGSEHSPGCRVDHPEDCGAGWMCQAGVCVRPTTGLTEPEAGTPESGAPDASSEPGVETGPEAQAEDASEGGADEQQEEAAADGPIEAQDGASEAAD